MYCKSMDTKDRKEKKERVKIKAMRKTKKAVVEEKEE